MDGTSHDMGFDHVIVASGARAQALLPDTVPNLRPVKGQYIRVRSQETLTSVVRTPDVYLIPRLDNEIYIGASQEEVGFQMERPSERLWIYSPMLGAHFRSSTMLKLSRLDLAIDQPSTTGTPA